MYTSFNARAVGLSLTAAETIDLAAAAGFGGVDLLVRDLVAQGDDPRALRARMDDLGLRGGAWPLPVDWRGEPDAFRRDFDRLPHLAEVAAGLGLRATGTWVLPETFERPDGEAARGAHLTATFGWHAERLGAIARVLGREGIRLGLEVIGVASSRRGLGLPFIHRIADVGAMLERIESEAPNVGVLVDAFHLYAAGEPMEAGLRWGVSRVVWVHVADLPATAGPDRDAIQDAERGLPAENGAVDSRGLLRMLAAGGYDGPVTAEPLGACGSLRGKAPAETARLVASALRSVWPPGPC